MSYGKINKILPAEKQIFDEKISIRSNKFFVFPVPSREIVSKTFSPKGNPVYKTTIENMTCKGYCTIESNFNMRIK